MNYTDKKEFDFANADVISKASGDEAVTKQYFILPAAPEEGEIADSDLFDATGGATASWLAVSMTCLLLGTSRA